MIYEIAYRILAVRERETYVRDLLERLPEPETSVFWDEDHNGCMWNAIRLWSSWVNLPESTTHLCLLADDADVCDNFKELAQMCVDRWPDAIWTFYSNQIPAKQKPGDTPYLRVRNYNARGLAYLMPKSKIKGYIDFYKSNLAQYKRWTHDDTTCKMYALLNRIPVMTTIPNLTRSREGAPSVIPDHRSTVTKNNDCWAGYKIDKAQFKTYRYGVSQTKQLFPLHLKEDEPICQKVKAEWKKQLLLGYV
jgi:hypothetical protein